MADTPNDAGRRFSVELFPPVLPSADFVENVRARLRDAGSPRTGHDEMAELAHKLAPHLEPLLGPGRSGMTHAVPPSVPFIPNPPPSSVHGDAQTPSWLSANEYIAAAATFITGLLVGLLLRM